MLNAVKAAPSLQKDVNKMLKFIENTIENYNPNKPPFFLQLIEEHLNSVPDPQNQTLKDYLVSKQTTLILALEKLITQVVVPTLMTTGTETNLNKLRNKIHKHQTDLKNLPNLKKELEKLQKQYGLDNKNKQLSTLSKKVLKLTNLQSEYSNALIINILLKHGIDSKYLIANLTPTITAINHSLLSNSEQILSISSYALNILKTENQNTKQEFLYKIFNIIDPAALLNANETEKLNNLAHQGQKLEETMHAILVNPELNIAQDLIKSFNIDPYLINTTIALIPKLMNNLPVDQKQLINLYNALKEVLTDDLENKFFSSMSLEQIAAIDNANIGKLMSLGGTILKEYGSMSDTNDNIAQDMEEFLLDPKIQKNIAQIASSAAAFLIVETHILENYLISYLIKIQILQTNKYIISLKAAIKVIERLYLKRI